MTDNRTTRLTAGSDNVLFRFSWNVEKKLTGGKEAVQPHAFLSGKNVRRQCEKSDPYLQEVGKEKRRREGRAYPTEGQSVHSEGMETKTRKKKRYRRLYVQGDDLD